MMGKIGIGVLILFLFFTIGTTPVIGGVHNWRTQDITQAEVVVTGGGETTANVVLDEDLFGGNTSEVYSITSTYNETPAATSYVAANNTLTISALAESQTRTLTIKYYAESADSIMQGVGPFVTPLIFLFVIGAVVWGILGTGGKRRG